MERIFGEDGYASAATGERLKQVMLLQEEDGLSIYGKTGMGKAAGVTVDAWFTGFAETFSAITGGWGEIFRHYFLSIL